MTTVMLIDGREVSTDSPEWRDECLARHRHVLKLRRLDRWARHDYVARVRRSEGDLAADRLVQSYGDDFERRKAAQRQALAEAGGDPTARP